MSARVRFQKNGEGGIAADIDAVDRVHLAGDFERHVGWSLGSVAIGRRS